MHSAWCWRTTPNSLMSEALPDASRNPAVSPDGSRIAVESGGGIVVLGQQGLAQGLQVADLGLIPSWSPDGTTIATIDPSRATTESAGLR